MATLAWKEPQAEDVKALMSTIVIDRANDNNQVQKLLSLRVLQVRGVVGRANTLSDNENEVPPEGLFHTLVLTVMDLVAGTPNFQFLIRGPDGAESGFGFNVRQAQRWLTEVADGRSVSYPTNPATEYPELVRQGSDEDEVDTTAS